MTELTGSEGGRPASPLEDVGEDGFGRAGFVSLRSGKPRSHRLAASNEVNTLDSLIGISANSSRVN